jgi:hypothetical protein
MNSENIKSDLWSAKKADQTYIVSIKDKSSILEALTDFVENQNIQSGQISGI